VHATDVAGIHVKATVFVDNELAGYEFEPDMWYEFDDVSPDVYNGTIGIAPKGSRQVSRLDKEPDQGSTKPEMIVERLGDLTRVAALDIETIATVDEETLEVGNPDHNEILCVGLGYRDRSSQRTESTVLFRKNRSLAAEQSLINEVVNWIEIRDIEGLLTFNGAGYDLPMLVGRSNRLATTLEDQAFASHVRDSLGSFLHADLAVLKNRVLGEGTLEDMAAHIQSAPPKTNLTDYDIALSPSEWRTAQWKGMRANGRTPPSDDLEDPIIYNSDVPHLGRHWLKAVAEEDKQRADVLYNCLEHYTAADIEPLFDIAESSDADGQPAFRMTYAEA
jgi:hypothetical protein